MDKLDAIVQHYAWGDREFIAALERRAPSGQPEAELWMGAHPKAPSKLRSSGERLDDHVNRDPAAALGPAARFGELPFLAKILAAAQPLSIQTHPDADRAQAGFDRENSAGVPLDAPERTYRDANHKPELICALTPFEAKCGFRALEATRELIGSLGSAVSPLADRLGQPGADAEVLHDVLLWLLSAEPADAAMLTNAVASACLDLAPGPWQAAVECTRSLQQLYPGDPGVVVALLLNHFTLAPGEALFLEAGVLHAYVRGAGVEIMANSDNVIRGGLTPKHVDIAELAAVVDCTPADPPVQRATGAVHTYDTPVSEFSLTRLRLDGDYEASVEGPEVLLSTEGSFTITGSPDRAATLDIAPGEPVWIAASDSAWHASGSGTLFRVTVPAPQ